MTRVVSISFGATNCCVAVFEGGAVQIVLNKKGGRTTPAVVGFTDKGERLVGLIAKCQAVINPENTIYAVKRLIGRKFNDPEVQHARESSRFQITEGSNGDARIQVQGRVYSPQEISGIVLQHLKAAAEDFLGEPVTEAIITVPAYFDDTQRQATKNAGHVAGFRVERVINEPTAAALAYGLGRGESERIAVYDLGGGTFDISILDINDGVYEVLATSGNTFLGGEDFDERIISWMVKQFSEETGIDLRTDRLALQRLKEAAERAKCDLSQRTETNINLPFIAADASGPKHFSKTLTRETFEGLISDLVERTVEPCQKALWDAKLQPKDIDKVLLVGGQTRSPIIARTVREIFGKDPSAEINPDEVVAMGAALLKTTGILFNGRTYRAFPSPTSDPVALAAEVDATYRQWLAEECGYIQLDGLPADTNLAATRLNLERLFVPLKAFFLSKSQDRPDATPRPAEILSIGQVLERAPHLVLLAVPGGGKSTLLKRLATAYAFTERRHEISDDLSPHDWLPLLLRCRELRERADRPIIELLEDIPRQAGMSADVCAVFQDSIHAALSAGRALLLIDGLDEISGEVARQTFANHLRTFLATFPRAALVVTSREAGFRHVAGVLEGACLTAKLAPLNEADVLSLCERWHVEVVGDNDKVRAEARQLGQAIWSNERIRKLAENPLLLKTLLVVKRWVGALPNGRAALYREAIRVLIRTWDVESIAPLDEEETLAQLSYVACVMTAEGKQQIGQKALLRLFQDARRELHAELQFARVTPQEYIDRIEYRSSLLMQTGHERTDDGLEPVYEFRHVAFQEYLAARGYVEEQYPGRDSGQSLADVLEPHFADESWQEVILLAALLAGRKAEELVKRLTRRVGELDEHQRSAGNPLFLALGYCLADGVGPPRRPSWRLSKNWPDLAAL